MTCDTHSAHLFSFESAVVAFLFSLPPSLFAFVQRYTEKKKKRRAIDQSAQTIHVHLQVLHRKETNIATIIFSDNKNPNTSTWLNIASRFAYQMRLVEMLN